MNLFKKKVIRRIFFVLIEADMPDIINKHKELHKFLIKNNLWDKSLRRNEWQVDYPDNVSSDEDKKAFRSELSKMGMPEFIKSYPKAVYIHDDFLLPDWLFYNSPDVCKVKQTVGIEG